MKYGSVCSGIEAATCAWRPLEWKPSFFSEIEEFPRSVLAHRYPSIPTHGDFTTIKGGDYDPIELLVGGTPCQSYSVAGLRKGLDDPRGNLMLGFGAIAKSLEPKWMVWENVPGVLSSNRGRDFGTFLGMLAELGYGFAYRVLDAQYFGVAQHRRRVFVVGCLGDWRSAAQVLFEPESVPRNIEAGRKERQNARLEAHGMLKGCGRPVAFSPLISAAITASPSSTCSPNVASGQGDVIAFDAYNQKSTGHLSKTIAARNDQDTASCVASGKMIRRLTPVECERLQGFEDDYTKIPYRGKSADKCPDGPRYKAIGNSMAVPVMRWIGERINQVDANL